MLAAPMRSSVVVRRRRRCVGGSPLAARRSFSAWRAVNASWMRRLRAIRTLALNSAMPVRLVIRHQPREVSLVAVERHARW